MLCCVIVLEKARAGQPKKNKGFRAPPTGKARKKTRTTAYHNFRIEEKQNVAPHGGGLLHGWKQPTHEKHPSSMPRPPNTLFFINDSMSGTKQGRGWGVGATNSREPRELVGSRRVRAVTRKISCPRVPLKAERTNAAVVATTQFRN